MGIPEGFRQAGEQVRSRLILSIEGKEKQGKTHFALTAPAPIAFFNLDMGIEGVVHKFAGKKEILVTDFLFDPMQKMDFLPEWERFKRLYHLALTNGYFRTVVIDTFTAAWALIRMARFGKLTQVMPHHYGPVNAEFESLVFMALNCPLDINIIYLHKQKPLYENDKKTSKYERAGYGDMGFLVQHNIEVIRNNENVFQAFIRDSRYSPQECGTVLSGDEVNFQMLAMTLLPQVPMEVWL